MTAASSSTSLPMSEARGRYCQAAALNSLPQDV
jgi:hypothetical protein